MDSFHRIAVSLSFALLHLHAASASYEAGSSSELDRWMFQPPNSLSIPSASSLPDWSTSSNAYAPHDPSLSPTPLGGSYGPYSPHPTSYSNVYASAHPQLSPYSNAFTSHTAQPTLQTPQAPLPHITPTDLQGYSQAGLPPSMMDGINWLHQTGGIEISDRPTGGQVTASPYGVHDASHDMPGLSEQANRRYGFLSSSGQTPSTDGQRVPTTSSVMSQPWTPGLGGSSRDSIPHKPYVGQVPTDQRLGPNMGPPYSAMPHPTAEQPSALTSITSPAARPSVGAKFSPPHWPQGWPSPSTFSMENTDKLPKMEKSLNSEPTQAQRPSASPRPLATKTTPPSHDPYRDELESVKTANDRRNLEAQQAVSLKSLNSRLQSMQAALASGAPYDPHATLKKLDEMEAQNNRLYPQSHRQAPSQVLRPASSPSLETTPTVPVPQQSGHQDYIEQLKKMDAANKKRLEQAHREIAAHAAQAANAPSLEATPPSPSQSRKRKGMDDTTASGPPAKRIEGPTGQALPAPRPIAPPSPSPHIDAPTAPQSAATPAGSKFDPHRAVVPSSVMPSPWLSPQAHYPTPSPSPPPQPQPPARTSGGMSQVQRLQALAHAPQKTESTKGSAAPNPFKADANQSAMLTNPNATVPVNPVPAMPLTPPRSPEVKPVTVKPKIAVH